LVISKTLTLSSGVFTLGNELGNAEKLLPRETSLVHQFKRFASGPFQTEGINISITVATAI
jgi:hypothetical protein